MNIRLPRELWNRIVGRSRVTKRSGSKETEAMLEFAFWYDGPGSRFTDPRSAFYAAPPPAEEKSDAL